LAGHGLTAEDYRACYNLNADYPMVAESYSEARRVMAKKIGLGRKPGEKVAKAVEGAVKTVRKTGKAALASAHEALTPES
jgi:predicted transcriptional regulator